MFKKFKNTSKTDNLKGLGIKGQVRKREQEHEINRQQKTNNHGHMKQTKNPSNNEMRFIGPRSHLEEEYPVDMVALNLTNRSRKDAGPLGGLRDQYEQVRGKVGELENIGNLGAQLSFEQRETLIYFEEIVKGDNGGGFWNDTEEESDQEEQIVKSKKSRNRHDSDRSDGRGKSHHDRGDRSDLSPKQRSRPQVARYRLMNDDEEFEASPNEYSSDEDEDIPARDQNNNYREHQGSSFGNQDSTPAHQLRPSGHSKWGNPVSNQTKEQTPVNARNFFQQKAAENASEEPVLPKSVGAAASMFGGQLKPTGQRNFGKSIPSNIEQNPRKSVARERSMSRDRVNQNAGGRAMSIERTRTRGESRERPRRAESRRRESRAESKDRTRDRSEDRRSVAMSIRRTESRSRREPSHDRHKRNDRDISIDREKRRRDRSEDREKRRRDRSENRDKRRERDQSEDRDGKERRRRRRSVSRSSRAEKITVGGNDEGDEEREERRRKRRERKERERAERVANGEEEDPEDERRRRRRAKSKTRSTRGDPDSMSHRMSKLNLNENEDNNSLDSQERREKRREERRDKKRRSRSRNPESRNKDVPADDLEALIKASHRARDRSTEAGIRRTKKNRDVSSKRQRNRRTESNERPSAQV